ncbi:hypothetical protein [Xanthomonas campestris]|uniref:hypothetical protein n=1 Tax=Xanthomonas campestris TaxID=339 RepID=UPI002B22C779|nr:hypothetical protein [Xanthomonas campestris]MEA9705647.1 hypothetical protein [Xanthomonas campestris pv. raphani]MEA9900570.1 hypothetical protein [Xanthomonas campestris pv. raphani]
MRTTHHDQIRALTGHVPSRRPTWKAVRGQLWLNHAIWLSGLSEKEFSDIYIRRGRSDSKLVEKWRKGMAIPSTTSVRALEGKLPGTRWVFDLPLFPLLADQPLSRAALTRLTQGTIGVGLLGPRAFQVPEGGYEWQSEHLVWRGDLWGLSAIVTMMRFAEVEADDHGHAQASMDAFRALPALLRTPWAAPAIKALGDALDTVRRRVPFSAQAFKVDWPAIEELAAAPDFHPDPGHRPRDAMGYAETYRDTVIQMRQVPARKQHRW